MTLAELSAGLASRGLLAEDRPLTLDGIAQRNSSPWYVQAMVGVCAWIAGLLLASGILGNLTDRILHGAVTDFLHFYIQEYAWPSFNVADSCICIAAALLILSSFGSTRRDGERAQRG